MNKNELLSAIKAAGVQMVDPMNMGATQVGDYEYVVPVAPIEGDEGGETRYVRITFAACNPTGTEKVPAFDLTAAVEKYEQEKAEKAQKAEEAARKRAEREAANEARKAARATEKAEREAKKAAKEAKKAE